MQLVDAACDTLIIGNTVAANERFIPITGMTHQLHRVCRNCPKPADEELLVGNIGRVGDAGEDCAGRESKPIGATGHALSQASQHRPLNTRTRNTSNRPQRFNHSADERTWMLLGQQLAEHAANRRKQCDMLMRIDDARRVADESAETIVLCPKLGEDLCRPDSARKNSPKELSQRSKIAIRAGQTRHLVRRQDRPVKSQTRVPTHFHGPADSLPKSYSRFGMRRIDEQDGRRDPSLGAEFKNPAAGLGADTEIIGNYDQCSAGLHGDFPRLGNNRPGRRCQARRRPTNQATGARIRIKPMTSVADNR